MTNYFFDVSDIVRYLSGEKTISGIQRAITMIIQAFAKSAEGTTYLSYYDDRLGDYFVMSADRLVELERFELTDIANALFPAVASRVEPDFDQRNLHQHLNGLRRGKFKEHLIRPGVRYAGLARKNLYRRLGGYSEMRQKFDNVFQEGDVLCILGALWDEVHLPAIFTRYKNFGLEIYVFVHDLIPIRLPQTVDVNPEIFQNWLKDTTNYATAYLVNSKHTGKDLSAFLKRNSSELPVCVTHLAQAPVPTNEQSANKRATHSSSDNELASIQQTYQRRRDVREIVKMPFVLNVGTIEARKNCLRQVFAWERLKRDSGIELPRLVFAGKKGWLNQDFFDAYKATGGWGGWVRIVEQPSDEDLKYLYERCEFTICASIYEGWGLPVGEGLSYGKTGVVSNVSSLPEVGGNMVQYCDPHSVESIADACRTLLTDTKRRKLLENRIAKTRLRNWGDVATDIAKVIVR